MAITILRLTGELQHWSPKWFSTGTGGIIPGGVSWVIGITWLAFPFGIYFALRLTEAGQGRRSRGRGDCSCDARIAGLIWRDVFSSARPRQLSRYIDLYLADHDRCGNDSLAAWPALFKTLLVYGLASRIPVAIIMLLAMRGNWGTHYDYVGMPPQFQMSLLPRYLWLAFFPQLIFWVGFTILVGSVSGSITAAIFSRPRAER